MSTSPPPNEGPEDRPAPEPAPPAGDESTQQVRVSRATARVPAALGSGVFSTGAVVMSGPNEFLVDFIQQFGQAQRVVARVVIPVGVMPQVIATLEQNLVRYEQNFGPPKPLPKPDAPPPRISIEELYDRLKLPDEMLGGVYANGVYIGHSPAEFSFDFIASFLPRSVVCARVFLSAPHIPPLLDSLKKNYLQVQQKPPARGGAPAPSAPPGAPPADPPPAPPEPMTNGDR